MKAAKEMNMKTVLDCFKNLYAEIDKDIESAEQKILDFYGVKTIEEVDEEDPEAKLCSADLLESYNKALDVKEILNNTMSNINSYMQYKNELLKKEFFEKYGEKIVL